MRKRGQISKTTKYRRLREAKLLGCEVDQLPDRRGQHKKNLRRSQHPRWNNGIAKSSHGYLKIQVGTSHPLSDPNGYAYLHHLVWVSSGLPFDNRFVLHHLNGDTMDNRLGNLTRITQANHVAYHNRMRSVKSGIKAPELDGRQWLEMP
jgi:hypothetical protein